MNKITTDEALHLVAKPMRSVTGPFFTKNLLYEVKVWIVHKVGFTLTEIPTKHFYT